MNAIVNFVTTIPIANIHPFEDNPYQVQGNEEMQSLCESIRENGVLSPLLVRKIGAAEEYEVISGHRRLYAAHKRGLTELPTVTTDLDRNAAAIALVDSNLHREHILPSEKAFAYKLKMEALSHQGAACGQAGHKSRDAVSDTDSGRQVQRYIRLTCLIPELLNKLNIGEMALSIGVELSYLDDQRQAKPVCRLTLLPGLQRKTSFLCGEKPETQSGILSLRQLQFRTQNVQNPLYSQRGA